MYIPDVWFLGVFVPADQEARTVADSGGAHEDA